MGSLTGDAGRLAAFTGQPFPNGLDLARCVIQQDLGVFVANPVKYFRAGMLVTKGASGIEAAAGVKVLGVAKWNKPNGKLLGAVVDEPVVFSVLDAAVPLKHANVSNVQVKTAAGNAGKITTADTDYTLNATNGTVAAKTGGDDFGDVDPPLTAYVSYTYELTEAELDFQGRNFWNFLDDVTIQDGHITVITDWSIIFTTQYDTSKNYTEGETLYCGKSATTIGLFTNVNEGSCDVVGKVLQVPSATDPYLGVILHA